MQSWREQMGATLFLNSKQLFYPSIINAPRNWVMPVQSVALLAEGSYNGGKCVQIRKILPTPLVIGGGNLGR